MSAAPEGSFVNSAEATRKAYDLYDVILFIQTIVVI